MSKNASIEPRYRNFACMVYLDSAPDNWREIVASYHVQAFISPLHDKDLNPTGEPKKPHYHVQFMFDGKQSEERVRSMCESFGGVGLEILKSSRGYARYLCHLDNPEKAQYDTNDVECIAGADYITLIGLAIDKYRAIDEMMDFCDEYNVVSFYALAKYARHYRSDWSRVLKDSSAIYMREYLQSRQWSIETNQSHIVDSNGEIII